MLTKHTVTMKLSDQDFKRLTALTIATQSTKSNVLRALLNHQNRDSDELASKIAAASAFELMPTLASFQDRLDGLEGAVLSLVDVLTTPIKPSQPVQPTQPADAQKTATVEQLPSLKEFAQKNIPPQGPVESEAEYRAYAIQKYVKKYGVNPAR